MTVTLPNDIVNNTPADATQVEQNYSVIESYLNNEVIGRDGSVAMAAPLLLVGDPTQDNQAANKGYVDAVLPVGVMFAYGGITAPAGGAWALCNGASLTTASFADLFAVIGYRFGGSGSNFLLPNMAGRMLIGVDAADAACDTVGEIGGTTTPPLLQHQHDNYHDHPASNSGYHSVDHTHANDHDHGGFESLGNAVPTRFTQVHVDATAPSAFVLATASSPNTLGDTSNGTHTHHVDPPYYSGQTGGSSANHYHSTSTPAYTGKTGNTVQAAVDKYRPPFMTVSYIIRVT